MGRQKQRSDAIPDQWHQHEVGQQRDGEEAPVAGSLDQRSEAHAEKQQTDQQEQRVIHQSAQLLSRSGREMTEQRTGKDVADQDERCCGRYGRVGRPC